MKPWKKNQKFILIIIFLLCFEYSNCVGICSNCESTDGITCVATSVDPSADCSNCKPKYISGMSTLTCHDCSGINGYYSIDSSDNCQSSCSGDKILDDTKECTSESIIGFYQMGEIYYRNDPSHDDSSIQCSNKICKCSKFYYTETIYTKISYHCFNSIDEEVGQGYIYYNYNTGEFFKDTCPNGFSLQKAIDSTSVFRCSDKCLEQEYYIEILDTNNNVVNKVCGDSCGMPAYSEYSYEYIDNGKKKCLKTCPSGTYIKDSTCVTLDECDFYQGTTCYNPCPSGNLYHNYGSKMCISGCSGDYVYKKAGDSYTCYKKEDCNFVDETDSDNKICLDSCDPPKYNDYNSKLCFENCGDGDSDKIYHANNKYLCYSSCSEIPGGDFIYEGFIDDSNDEKICYNSRPNNCDVYFKKQNGVRKCTTISFCVEKNYNYLAVDECREECVGYYQFETEISGIKYTECFASLSVALSQNDIKFCDTNQKICWTTFPDENTYFIKSEFTSPTGKYEIVRECPNFFYEITVPNESNRKCFKCTSNCKDINEGSNTLHKYFISGNKKCEDYCDKFNKYYYDDSNNECLDSCELRPTKQFSDKLILTSTPSHSKCLASCSESSIGQYYDYNSHTCISQCGNDNSNNLYFLASTITSDYSNICYPSCLDIPEGIYKYELSDKSCTNVEISLPHDSDGTRIYDYYYEKSNGVIKYVKASDCDNINYMYIVGNECKRNCEDNYYKIDFTISISGTDKTFTKCFSQPSQCIGAVTGSVVYYNQNLKKCWNEISKIPTNYFIKKIATDSFELVDECENYYYEQARTGGDILKYCISKCDSTDNPIISTHKYFISGNKKCLSLNECFNLHKYYYDPSNNECVETCKGRSTNKFQNELPTSFPSTATDLECLNACPGYYNYDSNICLSHCGADGSNKKYHANGNKVCYPSCLDIPRGTNGFYIYEVADTGTDGTFTCYDSYTASVCTYYYLKSDGTIRCDTTTDSCKDIDYFYLVEHSTNKIECKKNCEDSYKYEIANSFFECYDAPSDCPKDSATNVNYYNTKLKKCWTTYQALYFIKDASQSPNIELVEECEHYYYEGTTGTVNSGKNFCASDCNDNGLFFVSGKKICKSSCHDFTRYYYNPNNNECLETCKGLPNLEFANKVTSNTPQKCRAACDETDNSNKYYDYGSNICITGCTQGDVNKKFTINGGKVCYSSCAEIPGGDFIYEASNVCYTSPPSGSSSCAYYYIKVNGAKQCTTINDCYNTKKYKFFIKDENENFECRDSCDGYYKMEDEQQINSNNEDITKCYESLTKALSDNTIIYYNIKSKLCWKDYPDGYYIIPNSDTTNTKYEVVDECEFFYYKIPGDTDAGTVDKYYCTNSCKDSNTIYTYFVKGQKKCEEKCTDIQKHYYNPNNNECLDTCKGLPNLEFAKQVDSESPNQPCISGCASTEFYDYDSNICITQCGKDHSNYLYHTNLGSSNSQDQICYPSCKDIQGGEYVYESKELANNIKICSTQKPSDSDCPYYYMKKDGTLKCLSDANACSAMDYHYLYGKECRNECNDFFILEDADTTDGLIKCFKTKDECLGSTAVGGGGALYYNTKLKKCWKSYPEGYYIKDKTATTTFEMLEECEKYYYKDIVYKATPTTEIDYIKYICVENCKTETTNRKFYTNGQKNCEESCKTFGKYYYDPSTYECLDTCIGRDNLEFADYIDFHDSSSTPCKSACDSTQHYNFGTKICLNNADADTVCESNKFIKNGVTNECYDSCLEIPGKNNIYESATGNICYTKSELASASCTFYYQQNDGTMKCIPSTRTCSNEGFEYVLGNELCLKNCDDYYKYMDEGAAGTTKKCYKTLSEALAITDIKFYDTTNKKVWKNYPSNLFIYKDRDNNNQYEVVEECPNFYHAKSGMNYCTNNCYNEGKYFVSGNKRCETSCFINSDPVFNKYFYNPNNKECFQACSFLEDYKYQNPLASTPSPQECKLSCTNFFITKQDTSSNTIYECVESCPVTSDGTAYNLLDIKTNECLTTCSTDNYYVVNNKCYPKCDAFINKDTYECIDSCPSYLSKTELLTTIDLGGGNEKKIYLCKSACNTEDFRLDEKCLTSCPDGYNYIGHNKICKENCNADPNGERYYPINSEYSNADGYYPIYQCINSCEEQTDSSFQYYTEINPNECLSQCPNDPNKSPFIPFYLNSDPHKCLTKCPSDHPFYNGDSSNYECKDTNHCQSNTGDNKYYSNGACLTLQNCKEDNDEKIYISSNKTCLSECPEGEKKIKKNLDANNAHDGTYSCLSNCGAEYEINSDTKPECVQYCPNGFNYIGNENKCKRGCEKDGGYYYELDLSSVNPPLGYKIYKCIDGCKPENDGYQYREANNGNQCYKACTTNYPYLSAEENLCYDDCLKSERNPFSATTLDTDGQTLKVCSTQCDVRTNFKFYGKNKVCIEDCTTLADTKITNYDNQCVAKCNLTSLYPYQLGNKCVKKCYDVNDVYTTSFSPLQKRFSAKDYKCKELCGETEFLVEDNKCVTECNYFVNEVVDTNTGNREKECIPSCKSINKFYYSIDNKCLPQCNYNDKAAEDTNLCVTNCNDLTDKTYFLYKKTTTDTDPNDKCVLSCPSNKPYIHNGECVAICPENEKKYFQSEFTHGETERNKICLTDCPVNYPYYTIIIDQADNTKKYYGCQASCENYYVPNDADSLITAKLCLDDCPSGDYIFKIESEINDKKCYKTCPVGAKYHFDIPATPGPTDDNNCYEECPQKSPYHEIGKTICLAESGLTGGYLLYDKKEWVPSGLTKCPDGYNLYTEIEGSSSTVKVCLKECNFEHYDPDNNAYIKYEYLTPYNTCVRDCTSSPLVNNKYLINDAINKKCLCENLFYIDETSLEITCYSGSIGKVCKEMTNPVYPIPLNGTNQCLKSCDEDRILNPSENICYEKNTPCSAINSYTKLITTNGHKKCDCSYKYYFDSTHVNKTCLAENAICTGQNNLYIPATMECVNACPSTYSFKFRNFCLDHCPLGSTIGTNECNCGDKFWYESYPGNYECLDGECLDEFSLYAPQNKQCLKTCIGGYYPILFENKCYDKCDLSATGVSNLEIVTISSTLAKEKCECPRPWYYDPSNNNLMHCPDLSENINRCEDYTGKNINFMIVETRQCVKECPTDFPYYFNNKCYKSCESATEDYNILNIEAKESSYECVCQNLWYVDPQDTVYKKDKICYRKDINECPRTADITVPSTRYLILSTKECVDDRSKCPTNSFKFNFICYDKCPEYTLEGKEQVTLQDGTNIQDNICVCNTNGYLYLDYEKYGNKYYRCGLETCPEIFINEEQEEVRKNLLESESKCVKNCTEDGKTGNEYIKSFRNTCVKKCPNKTETYYDECRFYELTDEDNIDDLYKLKDAANIQAKELYEESEQMSGYLLNKFDASLQIYALNRYNNNKDLIMKSNLTYIDLGTCLDKIYEDNNLEDDEKILVTKYDLLTRNNLANNDDGNDDGDEEPQESVDDKYLINQVEYEFFLESTMEKLEASICSPYEIEISYPIFFNKNRFNNFAGGINANDYIKKFQIGKELHAKDAEIDTFNKDNKVYKDLCVGIELNGKDLVLEERYDYLYPNNVSLCESNCTMKNTDFDLERINCMCTYKEIFDFNRKDEDTNDILNDPNFHKTTQSSANAEIIKCLSKISVKQGIVKNEAFYYSAVVTAVEISMAVVSAVYGIKSVAGFMKGMLGMNQGNSIANFKKSNPAVTSTNRMLNNPPKKGEENTNEDNDDENKGNIVIKKNIKMNYNPNTVNNNELSEIDINDNDNNSNINYGLSIKSGFPKNKKKINIENEINNKTKVSNKYNTVNLYSNKKAEFIPPQYNFKFFKPNDKGIVKKIERSKIPFDVDKDTKILIETKKDVIYDDNYLDGPFYEDQNIIEIIDDANNNTNKVIKFNESNNNINNNFDSSVIIKKNINKNNNRNDISAKEEIPKTKKRGISNKINSEEKDFITIKKINPITSLQMTVEDYKEEEEVKNVDSTTSIYNLVKREHTYLRVTYERYIAKRHPNILATFLAEILDKIYFIKIFIFLKKFDIFSIHLALYMFYHILLLSLLCGFFTIKVIKKIWEDSNYPTMNFYLLYGFLGNVIIWIIYRVFILLLDNQDRFRALVKLHNESMNNNTSRANLDENKEININGNDNNKEININQQDMVNVKYEELIKKIKIQTAVFYIIIILITAFCFIYLVSFFAIYTGTKGNVFKAYYISIIEIILIKFVYGLCLASLRIAGEGNELKSLYNFVYYCDKYVS